MTETAERMKSHLLELSIRDRAELAQFLIQSLDEGDDPNAEAAWDTELSRRMQDIESGVEAGESADSVFEQLRMR
ncbi:MAG: addiction module protein [Planctomycetota bacterium]|nr:addiction module protein [Planctomycetota bacterium]